MDLPKILSYSGFFVFLLVWFVNGIFLAIDLRLLLTGEPTISHQTWARPMLLVGLASWQVVGLLGLITHLLIYPYWE